MSTWSARHDSINNNNNTPVEIVYNNELDGKREVDENVVVEDLKLLKPDINNQVEVMEKLQKDPTLNQLNGTDDMEEEDMWFSGNLHDSPPQSPTMTPSIDTTDWSGDEEEELELSRKEFNEFIEKDNENSAAILETLRRQLSPDRISDMNGPTKAELTIGLEILSQLSPDRALGIENAHRSLENPIESSRGCRFSATSGPLTPSDVVWAEEPPPLTSQPSPWSIRSTRSPSSRLSISSSASSISPVKIPKVGRKTRQTRRTKETMNAMSPVAKENMKRERNKFHARDSAARKKEEMADWERRAELLELELSQTNRQLEIRDFNEAIEATRALNRFELEKEIEEIKLKLAEIEIEKAKNPQKATTFGSQKCRANRDLKVAKLKLRALDLLEKAYGRELMDENMEHTSTESDFSEPASINDFSPGADGIQAEHQYAFGGSASAEGLATCQPDDTAYNDKSFDCHISQHGNYDAPPITANQMYNSSVAAQPHNSTATSQLYSQIASDGHNGPVTGNQPHNGALYDNQSTDRQFAGGLALHQGQPTPYNGIVYDGQATGQPFGGTTHIGQTASQQFDGAVSQYGYHGAPPLLSAQMGVACNGHATGQQFDASVSQHWPYGASPLLPEQVGLGTIDNANYERVEVAVGQSEGLNAFPDRAVMEFDHTVMPNRMNYTNSNAADASRQPTQHVYEPINHTAQYPVNVVSRYEETFGESAECINYEPMDVDIAGYSGMKNRINHTNISAPMSQEQNPASQAPAA